MYPVELTSRRLALREFSEDDVQATFDLVGDDRVTAWLSFDSRSRDEAADMVHGIIQRAKQEPRTEFYLGIARPDRPDYLIGFIRLALDGVKAGKLGYAIHADHWGHGFATEAAQTMLDFSFTDLGLHRISVAIGPDNYGSMAVARRLGMQLEGVIRDHVFTNGAWRDSWLFSLLAHEWRTSRAAHTAA